MFCRKCGKQISDDSLFCRECGEKVDVEMKSTVIRSGINNGTIHESAVNLKPTATESEDKEDIIHKIEVGKKIKTLRMIFLASLAVIALLIFTKMVDIFAPILGAHKYSFLEIFKYSKAIGDLSELLNSSVGILKFVGVTGIIGSGLILLFVALSFVKEWSSDVFKNGNDVIIVCCTFMSSIIVIMGILLVLLFCISIYTKPMELSFTKSGYIILALAVINRFLILPKYNDVYYNEIKLFSSNS